MNLKEASDHCETAWANYAAKNNVSREGDAFYILKLQEELGELTRSFLETHGQESLRKGRSKEELQRKLQGDCVSMIGNALIFARHLGVNIEEVMRKKFPIDES